MKSWDICDHWCKTFTGVKLFAQLSIESVCARCYVPSCIGAFLHVVNSVVQIQPYFVQFKTV